MFYRTNFGVLQTFSSGLKNTKLVLTKVSYNMYLESTLGTHIYFENLFSETLIMAKTNTNPVLTFL